MACKFFEKLQARWDKGARVCVGLDIDSKKIPAFCEGHRARFMSEIVKATHGLALAYKPNIAFFAHEGQRSELFSVLWFIRSIAPDVPIILDAKRGDIDNTNNGYIVEAFMTFGSDAVTVNPYFGMRAMAPFLDRKDKGIIVVCRTSNPGSGEFQDVTLVATDPPNRSMLMYEYVAERVATRWNYNGNCALVVGATYPNELKRVREIVGDMWILAPGVGAQGGSVERTVRSGLNSKGSGLIVSSSSAIIYASSGTDFAQAARAKTIELTNQINAALVPA